MIGNNFYLWNGYGRVMVESRQARMTFHHFSDEFLWGDACLNRSCKCCKRHLDDFCSILHAILMDIEIGHGDLVAMMGAH